MKKYLILSILSNLLLALVFNGHLNAQCNTTPCVIPEPSVNAQDACILPNPAALDCYFGATTATNPESFPPSWCTTIENNHFFAFTADASFAIFEICTYGCAIGNSIQAAVLATSDCVNFQFVSPCLGNIPTGSCQTLTATNLVVGQNYYLMMDGTAGALCDYSINWVNPTINGPTGSFCLPSSSASTYTANTVSTWTINPPTAGNIQGNPISTSVDIIWAEPGPAQVCARSLNCPNAPNLCLDIVIGENVEGTEMLEICQGHTVDCGGQTFSNGGNFTVTLPSYSGCDSVVHCLVNLVPTSIANLGARYVCQDSCFHLGDSLYCNSGNYVQFFKSYLGCDSIVSFSLAVIPINTAAAIKTPQGQIITCIHPTLQLQAQTDPNVSHLWKNFAGDTLGTGNSITINTPGNYFHEVKSAVPGVGCSAQAKILIKKNSSLPPVTAMGGTLDAAHPTVQLMGHSIISGVTYLWTGPNGFISTLKKPIVSTPGFYTLTLTNPQTGCSNSITVEVTAMD